MSTVPEVIQFCASSDYSLEEKREVVRLFYKRNPQYRFQCIWAGPNCRPSYKQESTVRDHYRVQHLHERRFECKICLRRFKKRQHMQLHIQAIHSGVRPFVCKMCMSSFKQLKQLRRHQVSDHKHKCPLCELVFLNMTGKNSRDDHMRRVHPEAAGTFTSRKYRAGYTMHSRNKITKADHLWSQYRAYCGDTASEAPNGAMPDPFECIPKLKFSFENDSESNAIAGIVSGVNCALPAENIGPAADVFRVKTERTSDDSDNSMRQTPEPIGNIGCGVFFRDTFSSSCDSNSLSHALSKGVGGADGSDAVGRVFPLPAQLCQPQSDSADEEGLYDSEDGDFLDLEMLKTEPSSGDGRIICGVASSSDCNSSGLSSGTPRSANSSSGSSDRSPGPPRSRSTSITAMFESPDLDCDNDDMMSNTFQSIMRATVQNFNEWKNCNIGSVNSNPYNMIIPGLV